VASRVLTGFVGPSLVVASLAYACSPELVIGAVDADTEACPLPNGEGGAPSSEEKVVEIGWETGFENGFCDYRQALGFCYSSVAPPEASYSIVDTPVRTGKSSAAFSVVAGANIHTRCFLEGVLPRDAVYGAWFYIPALAQNTGNWNLVFIQGAPGPRAGLWDVSLRNTDDGGLQLYIYSHRGQPLPPEAPVPVPIGRWFHVEFRLLRATDATGAVGLYQDGVPIQEATGIVTDAYETHQWYVGNLANALDPAESTLYVDDVTVRERRDP
jgi:hypothetical protein